MLLVACVGVGTKNKTLTFFGGGVSRFKDTDGRYESGRRMPSWKISFVLKTLNQFDKKKSKKSFRTFIKSTSSSSPFTTYPRARSSSSSSQKDPRGTIPLPDGGVLGEGSL